MPEQNDNEKSVFDIPSEYSQICYIFTANYTTITIKQLPFIF